MLKYIKTILLLLLIISSSNVYSESDIISMEERQDYLRDKVSKLDSGYKDSRIIPTTNPNFYLVVPNGGSQKIYITKDGESLIFGSIFKNINDKYLVDLENELLNVHRKDTLDKLNKNLFIKYPATSDYKTDLFVFTDMSCPYCKRKHENLDIIRKAGFDVYYIPYPRMGLTQNLFAVKSLKKIMCSMNPNKSFNEAFKNPEGFAKNVKDSEINCEKASMLKDFYKLGDVMGVEGTPATFLPNGAYISGFSSLPSFLKDLTKKYSLMLKIEEDVGE